MDNLFNPEFEKYFLGSCMIDPQVFVDSNLSTDDFGTVDHQCIYAAIATVHEECGKTDPLLVADELKKSGDLNRAGGMETIYNLQAVVTETESAIEYAKEIRQLSMRRKIATMMATSRAQIMEIDTEPEAVIAKLEQDLADLQFQQQELEYYSAVELSEMEIEPVKWFVPGFLPSGLTILSGPPKIGKSFFCWNMALAVATGGVAFSSVIIPDPYNVSYLSFEDTTELLKERLEMLSPDRKPPPNLYFMNDMQGKKFDAVGLKMIEKHLDKTGSELLIVDTWKHVTPDVDIKGTSYDIDYAALIPVQRLAHRRNIGIVLVTHNRKAVDIDNPFNMIQGSVGMQAGSDTMMTISHDSGAKTLHLSGRRIPSDQFAFTINEGVWVLEGNSNEYHGSELRREIRAHLKDAGDMGLSAGDLIDLTGKKDSNVRQALRRMVKGDEINQPKKRGDYFYKGNDDDDGVDL